MVDNGGFTIDGVAVSTYGVTLMYAPGQPMLPGTRDRTKDIAGKDGLYWFDSDLEGKFFSLPCQFQGAADAAALDVLIRAFALVLVDVYGKPRAFALVFDDDTAVTYIVRYAGGVPFDRAWCGCSDFVLHLVADDPYGYEAEEITTKTITTSPGTMTVTGTGNVAAPCRVCIKNNGAKAINGFTITIGGWTVPV